MITLSKPAIPGESGTTLTFDEAAARWLCPSETNWRNRQQLAFTISGDELMKVIANMSTAL
jgi:hypothetical protein